MTDPAIPNAEIPVDDDVMEIIEQELLWLEEDLYQASRESYRLSFTEGEGL